MVSVRNPDTRLRRLARRWSLVRRIEVRFNSGLDVLTETVDTVVPLRWLATWAAEHQNMQVAHVTMLGLFRTEWLLIPGRSKGADQG